MIGLSKILPKRKSISKVKLKEMKSPFGESEPLKDVNTVPVFTLEEAESKIDKLIIHKEDDMNGKSK